MGEKIQFSKRGKQVIKLLILGKSNKQIALSQGFSVRGVEFQLSNIYVKLGVTSRREAGLKLLITLILPTETYASTAALPLKEDAR